jgi:membrane-bound serine protease (ClpP class)
VNVAGLALLLLGLALLVAELFAPTHGVLSIGGVISFTIGSLILIKGPREVQVSRPLIAGVAISLIGFFVFALGAIVKGQKRKVVTGIQGMIGRVAEVRTRLDPTGRIFADGTLWTAEAIDGPIELGEEVEIVAMNGLRATVQRIAGRELSAEESAV